jgi:putative transposase
MATHDPQESAKVVLAPGARRQAVAHLQEVFEVSQRRACTVLGADRTTMRYVSCRPDDAKARERIRDLASQRRRFGYRGCTGCCAGRDGR